MTELFDNAQALQEGWGIFDCEGSANGAWQIQKCDDSDMLGSDVDAWRLVLQRAYNGSAYHRRALEFIRVNSGAEFDTLQSFANQRL